MNADQGSFHAIDGAKFLITGGTGSFGRTMVQRLLRENAAEIVVFSRDEAKQDQMRLEVSDARVRYVLGDTRDSDSVSASIKNIDYVFHAAAIKQVPSAEFFPQEAVKTNIVGSANVIRAGLENAVKAIVCLSTDKAVYPINAMGMSKALMEKVAVAMARDAAGSGTRICVTRYGNVMYSRGSVIPKFFSQLRESQTVTLTETTMTRFIMSLEESVSLVLHAFLEGQSGDTLVRKAPAASMENLSKAVANLLGIDKYQVNQVGFRHGEKLFESLLASEEMAKADDQGEFFRVPMDERDLNYEPYFEVGNRRPPDLEAYTSHNTYQLTINEIQEALLSLPEVRRQLGNGNS